MYRASGSCGINLVLGLPECDMRNAQYRALVLQIPGQVSGRRRVTVCRFDQGGSPASEETYSELVESLRREAWSMLQIHLELQKCILQVSVRHLFLAHLIKLEHQGAEAQRLRT